MIQYLIEPIIESSIVTEEKYKEREDFMGVIWSIGAIIGIILLAILPYTLGYSHSGDYVECFNISSFYDDVISVDRIALLEEQAESFEARIEMITSATESIDLACFSTHDGEYMGEGSIHAKTYIVDDRLSIIGSYNFDPRSANIDTEMMLVIDGEEFTSHVRSVVQEQMNKSLMVDEDGGYISSDEVVSGEVPLYKKIMQGIARVVLAPFKSLV